MGSQKKPNPCRVKKLYKCFKKEVTVKFVLHYQSTKVSYFTSTKNKTPFLSQSSVIYKFVCPGCKSMIGQRNTSTPRVTRMSKAQFMNIWHYVPITATLHIYSRLTPTALTATQFNVLQIRDNSIILDRGNNWSVFLFKEALMSKKHRPS